jgi:hypothetical protein
MKGESVSVTSKDLLRTANEMAQMYQNAIVELIEERVSTYTIAGRSYTKNDLDKLERGLRYWSRQATIDHHGGRSAPDVRTSGDQP